MTNSLLQAELGIVRETVHRNCGNARCLGIFTEGTQPLQ